MKPLEGLLVVSLEQAVAAPYCTSRLADAGARIIKVERPEGDFARQYDRVVHGESAYFVWLNRGKESICLNIKDRADKDLLLTMLTKADVYVQNLAPGAAERAGVGSEDLRRKNPRLITVDITGYGESGPWRRMKAYDLLVQCETGLASITGSVQEPGRVGVSVCDIACGMYAHTAVLEALIERGITGRGRGIRVSLFDAMADWMTVPLLHQEYGKEAPARMGLNHPSIAPYGVYPCGGEDRIVISIQNQREWLSFCEVVLRLPSVAGDDRFLDNTARCHHRSALDDIINEVFTGLGRKAVIERLMEAGVAFGSVNTVEDLSHHPQLRRMDVESPSGPVRMVCPPARLSDEEGRYGAVPELNQHGDRIREEFSHMNEQTGA